MGKSWRTGVRTGWARIRAHATSERGATLVLVSAAMSVVLSVTALAVDVGMLMSARTEAQRTADLAALAGAGGLVDSPDNEQLARLLATEFASRNDVRRGQITLRPEDIQVDLANDRVTVTVNRTAENGNPVGTFFARIFGVGSVDVRARATAEASPAGGINCLLPLALPDRWLEGGGPGNDPADFNPEDGDVYIPWADTDSDPLHFNDPYTGYSDSDVGVEFPLKANGGGGSMNPSWYYPWRPPGQSGAADYRTNINSCVDPSIEYSINMEVETEPGSMSGPTRQGFQDLIGEDPTAAWNSVQKCVTDFAHIGSSNPEYCRGSPRVRPIPMFDPREAPDPGNKPFTFTNFAGIFVDRIQGNTVYGRFMGYRGLTPPGPASGVTAGPQFKVLRLVE